MAEIKFDSIKSKDGMVKELDKSSLPLIFDVLQGSLYNKPIDSSIRESVSNSMDSIKEREMAKNILNNINKVSDFYDEDSVSESTKDSKFDISYYDLKYLSNNNTVRIVYTENPNLTERDTISISDEGVGLGGSRLIGWTKLGYSSKRLTKNQLGGFGLGCKAPLSTGVESFRMTSRYNGKEYCLDAYNDKIDSVYGKWNEDGTTNEYFPIETSDGNIFKVYYKNTDKKNGVTISFDVKKHNKDAFFRAVKNQLSYLKEDITFTYINQNGYHSEQQVKANILYEDDNVIIADNSCYNMPHFVMKGITYGLVDFRELELDEKRVSIGIKVDMNEVDVVPSRESIQYTSKTKQTVIDKFNKIVNIVIEKLNKTLDVNDFFEWQNAFYAILGSNSLTSGNSDAVTNRIGKLVDKSSLNLKFKDINAFIGDSKFYGSFIERSRLNKTYSNKTKNNSYSKVESNSLSPVELNKVVLCEGMLTAREKVFLYENGFSMFSIKESNDENLNKIILSKEDLKVKIKKLTDYLTEGSDGQKKLNSDSIIKSNIKSLKILHYMLESKNLKSVEDFRTEIDNWKIDKSNAEEDEDITPAGPKVKKKADRSFINVKSASSEFKVNKKNITDHDFIYFINDSVEAKAFVNHFAVLTLENKMTVHKISGKTIVSIAGGNERYVKDHWKPLDMNLFTFTEKENKDSEDKTYEAVANVFYKDILNDIYTKALFYKMAENASVNYWEMQRLNESLKLLNVLDYDNLNLSKLHSTLSVNINDIKKNDKYFNAFNLLNGNIGDKSIVSHDLINSSEFDVDLCNRYIKLLKNGYSNCKEILNSKLYVSFKADFDKTLLQIYNNIIKNEL